MLSAKLQPFCLGLNLLRPCCLFQSSIEESGEDDRTGGATSTQPSSPASSSKLVTGNMNTIPFSKKKIFIATQSKYERWAMNELERQVFGNKYHILTVLKQDYSGITTVKPLI